MILTLMVSICFLTATTRCASLCFCTCSLIAHSGRESAKDRRMASSLVPVSQASALSTISREGVDTTARATGATELALKRVPNLIKLELRSGNGSAFILSSVERI